MERYRIYSDGAVYFVTFSIVDWLPVFVSESACRIITDSLNHCHHHKGLRTNAYVIMPTHFHGVVFFKDFNPESLKSTLTDFRKIHGATTQRLLFKAYAIMFCRCLPPTGRRRSREAVLAAEPAPGPDRNRSILEAEGRLPARQSAAQGARIARGALAVFIGLALASGRSSGQRRDPQPNRLVNAAM
jgi:hypothetical protein